MMSQCHHQCLLKIGLMLLIAVLMKTIWTNSDSEYDTTKDPNLFSQKLLNDLIRDFCLSKEKAELLASRLKERNIIEKDQSKLLLETQ